MSQYYDNLVAKLIVWAEDREAARRRMLRALEETRIEGVATTIPADVAILSEPEFVQARHSTRWVEEKVDLSDITSEAVAPVGPPSADGSDPVERVLREVTAEVDGRRYAIKLWVPDVAGASVVPSAAPRKKAQAARASAALQGGATSGSVTVPMQGTIVKVLVAVGDNVEEGQTICILEAMKMENSVNAERAGVVAEIRVSAGDSVGSGDVVAVIE